MGGTVLPLETLSPDGTKAVETLLSREPHLSSWVSALPTDSILNYLLYNSEYEASFPRMEGTLFLPVEGKQIMLGGWGSMVSVIYISLRQAYAFKFSRLSTAQALSVCN